MVTYPIFTDPDKTEYVEQPISFFLESRHKNESWKYLVKMDDTIAQFFATGEKERTSESEPQYTTRPENSEHVPINSTSVGNNIYDMDVDTLPVIDSRKRTEPDSQREDDQAQKRQKT
jgi:hypothetical protein